MPGKRPRPLQRTQSIAHLNFDDNANQCSPLPEQQPIEKQKAGRGPVMCAARQVIGFAPKANVEIDFAEKKVPSAAAAAAGACSRPCGPQQRSGLCDLLSGSGGLPCWKKDAQTQSIGLGIALEKEHEPCGGVKGVEHQHQALAATATAAAHQPVVSPPRTPKASTPIPIQGLKPRFEHPPVRTRPESFLSKAVEAEEQQIAAQALAAAEEESADGNKLLLFTALAVAATPPPKSTPAETGFAALHFLDACHFCKRIFGEDRDIYMYRGDKAFCSVECRHHQIVLDERLEKCSAAALAGSAITPARHMSHRNRVMAVAAGTAAAA